MAVVFMLTSLTLGYFAEQGTSTSIFDSVTPQTQTSPQPAPVAAPAGRSTETPAEAPASP